jgi:hypothetical protein
MQVQHSEKEKLYKKPSSSSFQPNASYIDGSASSLVGTEKGTGAASFAEMGTDLEGVATAAGGAKLISLRGELLDGFAGVSNTADGARSLLSGEDTAAFDGVAKILLRTASDEKALPCGALDGVSAILGCTRLRAVALRWPVAGTIGAGTRAPEDGTHMSLERGASVAGSLTNGL